MAQLKDTTINGKLTVNGDDMFFDNGYGVYGTNTDGQTRLLAEYNVNNCAMFGYGGYINNEGKTYLDGNELYIRSKGGIYIYDPDAGLSGRAYGQNKVLWSGGYMMTAGHTVTLSEAVKAQPNGIVLIWSAYSSSTVQNFGFTTTFIPKYFVEAHPGAGVDCPLIRQSFGKVGSKYLYVNNTQITGQANNNATGTANGVTYDNSYFVLRYVIGV